jgi:hypothetical protein
MASDLITLAEYGTRTATDLSSLDATQTAQIEAAITTASSLIRSYLDRDVRLASEEVAGEVRTFNYTGGNVLEIDDATSVISVATSITPWSPASRTLDATEWTPEATTPNVPVFDAIELWTNLPFVQSPSMGFKWNEDTIGWRAHPVKLDVSANWGWASIPDDIKQAAVWQVEDVITPESPYISESIEGYSHSLREARGTTNVGPITAVTGRVRAVLDPYTRLNV